MKKIEAIIKPFKLDEVKEAPASQKHQRHDGDRMKGFGRQKGHTELYRGAEYVVDFLPKIKIEILVTDEQRRWRRDDHATAKTGRIGDGKLFVLPWRMPCASEPANEARAGVAPGEPHDLREIHR